MADILRDFTAADICRTASMCIALVHLLVLLYMFFDFRVKKRTFLVILILYSLPFLAGNLLLYMAVKSVIFIQVMLITVALPCFILFILLSRYRGSRFIFTFFFIITGFTAFLILTAVIDKYLCGDAGIFSLISRFIIFLFAELTIYFTDFSKTFRRFQTEIPRGWLLFSLVTALYYFLMIQLLTYPQSILEDPAHIPTFLSVSLLAALMYTCFFQFLYRQQQLHEARIEADMLTLERNHISDIIAQNAATEERLRIERHDLRHRFLAVHSMLVSEEYDRAREYIQSSVRFLDINKRIRHCQNPIVDAVVSTFFAEAQKKGIRIESSLAIPNDLPMDAHEFSIVLANALENAINACMALPENERTICCKYVTTPQHMCQISNPYIGEILFDEEGLPTTDREGHGIGTKSIQAFCNKHGATVDYKVSDGWFYFRIIF